MLARASMRVVPHSLAIHALTIGAIGCAIIGMITRTAFGHTGRPIVAGRAEIASYALLIGTVVVRDFGLWFAASASALWIDIAAAC
jgi:uncharacterized protein involved in response to NO